MVKEPEEFNNSELLIGSTYDTDSELEVTIGLTQTYLTVAEVNEVIKHLCAVQNFNKQEISSE
jgi:hypothetical protein